MQLRPRVKRVSYSESVGECSKTNPIKKAKNSVGRPKKSGAKTKRGPGAAALIKSLEDVVREKKALEKSLKECEEKMVRLEADRKATQDKLKTTEDDLKATQDKLKATRERTDPGYSRDLECPICMELFVKPVILNCTHSFCAGCLHKWLAEAPPDVKNKCPMCQRRVVSKLVDRVVSAVVDWTVATWSPEKLAERKAREEEHAMWMEPRPRSGPRGARGRRFVFQRVAPLPAPPSVAVNANLPPTQAAQHNDQPASQPAQHNDQATSQSAQDNGQPSSGASLPRVFVRVDVPLLVFDERTESFVERPGSFVPSNPASDQPEVIDISD